MLKGYLIAAVAVVGFGGGTFFGSKVLDKKCPDCNCPTVNVPPCPAAVSLQNFDLDKLNNKKGTFTYSPQLNNVKVVIESKDSTLVKNLLKAAR